MVSNLFREFYTTYNEETQTIFLGGFDMFYKIMEAMRKEVDRLEEKRKTNEILWQKALLRGDDAVLCTCLQVLDDIQEEMDFLEAMLNIFKT